MKDQELVDVMYDTKLYLVKYLLDNGGRFTDDERDVLNDLIDCCRECLNIDNSIREMNKLKNL